MDPREEAKPAEHYDRTHDLSEFTGGSGPIVHGPRGVTISVRFSESEIAEVRRRAEAAGSKVTAYIRDAALDAVDPLDRDHLRALTAEIEERAKAVSALTERKL